jgi:hypothetical protein
LVPIVFRYVHQKSQYLKKPEAVIVYWYGPQAKGSDIYFAALATI